VPYKANRVLITGKFAGKRLKATKKKIIGLRSRSFSNQIGGSQEIRTPFLD